MHSKLTTRELALCAALASISAIMQLMHIGFQSFQIGLWVDMVASSWIIAYFLFGVRGALITSLVGAIIITLFAPETWLGAIMKWSTTLPIWLTLYLAALFKKNQITFYANPINLLLPVIIGLIIRTAIALPLNYYFAIPFWTGMSPHRAMHFVPWYLISGFNSIQGIIDVGLAWLITYKFKLSRFATIPTVE